MPVSVSATSDVAVMGTATVLCSLIEFRKIRVTHTFGPRQEISEVKSYLQTL